MTKKARSGRKPLDPQSPVKIVPVRIPLKLFNSLKDLAEKHGRDISKEIRKALERWIERHEIPTVHTSAFATAIAVLADRVEGFTGEKWIDHPLTRQVVREYVERLVSHILAPLSEPVAVPAEVKEDAEVILSLLMHAMPRPGSPRRFSAGTIIIDDRGLAAILQDLARDLGEGHVNVETRPELVARRKRMDVARQQLAALPEQARKEADEKAWADAQKVGSAAALYGYVQIFRSGAHATEARERLAADQKAWVNAEKAGTVAAFTGYIRKFGSGARHVGEARERLAALEKQKGRKK